MSLKSIQLFDFKGMRGNAVHEIESRKDTSFVINDQLREYSQTLQYTSVVLI